MGEVLIFSLNHTLPFSFKRLKRVMIPLRKDFRNLIEVEG